jgi:hypothetical protein
MYLLNKDKKRLEPTETKCAFCEADNSSNMEENYFIPLFRENDRTNIIVYRSVKYSKIPVGIPRCKSCMEIHEQAASKGALIAWAVAVGVVVLSFMMWGIYGIFTIFIGIFVGFLGTNYMQNKIVREKGIFTKRDGAERNEVVQGLIIEGWSFNQPTA